MDKDAAIAKYEKRSPKEQCEILAVIVELEGVRASEGSVSADKMLEIFPKAGTLQTRAMELYMLRLSGEYPLTQ